MKKALISVSDKTGILAFAKLLHNLGYELISTGGTMNIIKEGKIPVTGIEEYTGFPEILDGRVKTLHPKVHAGLLFKRGTDRHMKTMEDMNISSIDMVVVNLYPFEETYKSGKMEDEIIENIDIGGPTLIRSAAKNYKDVIVVTDPSDYIKVGEKIKNGEVDETFRKYLAMKAFSLTAYYDSFISRYFMEQTKQTGPYFSLGLRWEGNLRYGENPHQKAHLYKDEFITSYYSDMEQIHGKELSFNNLHDLNTAVELVGEWKGKEPVIAVAVKHATPCGVGIGQNVYEAFEKAYTADPLSIFGGVVAVNDIIDEKTAIKLSDIFLEIIAAPQFTPKAFEILKEKKNVRLLKINFTHPQSPYSIKYVSGKVLFQDMDNGKDDDFKVVTKKVPTDQEIKDMLFAMKVCKYVKSNGIVIVKDNMTLGIGGGQTSRIWALESIFQHHPNRDFTGGVLASDAFFPFDDVVKKAKEKGIRAIIQPGGSIRDQDSIKACDEAGISMIFTGTRHFRH